MTNEMSDKADIVDSILSQYHIQLSKEERLRFVAMSESDVFLVSTLLYRAVKHVKVTEDDEG